MKRRNTGAWVALAAVAWAWHGPALAQASALAPGQVSGAELQSWLDADGMPFAGINLVNGCHFIAKGKDTARIQTIFCPTMTQPFTVTGEIKIVGNQMCSKFTYPDGNKLDACQDVIRVGDNKFEVRLGGAARSVLYRLVR